MFNLFSNKEDQLEDEYLYEQLSNLRGYLHEVENQDIHDPYRKEDMIAELTIDIINLEEYIMERHHRREIRPFKITFYVFLIIMVSMCIFTYVHSLINS